MSSLITCKNISKSFGAQTLFSGINLAVNGGDRIGVIGPNGSGKSTLLKILCGLEEADEGQVLRQKYSVFSYLAQSDSFDDALSITENLYAALAESSIEETEKYNRIHSLVSKAEFPEPDSEVGLLSGGWRKRLAICRSLLLSPDLLVMDEPTNHLDIEGILWLEKILSGGNAPEAYLLVSHDRRFLENCTNRVVELSAVYPEGTMQVNGSYSRFLEVREAFLAGQQEEEVRLANKARREIEWLRRGPKARTSKAKYRIDEAHKLTDDLAGVKARNRAVSSVQIDFDATGRKTKKLLELKSVSKAYGELELFENLDMVLAPGTKIGLLGRNGCGKSTLMKILAGAADDEKIAFLKPDSGSVKAADNIQVVSFDQKREAIDPEITLRRALAPDGDSVVFRGRSLHVVSWAKKFLFRPDQLETPVGQLSGGEQARILIAGLMRQPADILLLDEPTNDLDIASLDVLEASLLDFPGAVVLVSHDRFLLSRLCDRVLGFGGPDGVAWYADYTQWIAELEAEKKKKQQKKKILLKGDGSEKKIGAGSKNKKPGKLTYMDQREYDQIEGKIADAEARVEALQQEMDSSEIVAKASELARVWEELEDARAGVDALYARWEELEEKKGGRA